MNEVYGFAAENLTDIKIEAFVTQEICDNLNPDFQSICDALMAELPLIVRHPSLLIIKIQQVEHMVPIAVICVEHGFCQAPFSPHPDPYPVPKYVINLDLPPLERCTTHDILMFF